MKNIVLRMLLLIIALYVGASYYLYSTQNEKVFNRKSLKSITPVNAKLIEFKTNDGLVLEGAFIKHGDNLPLVLYFGGNNGNVVGFLDEVASKIDNYNFVAFNYPGYANSQGKPSEQNVLKYANEIYAKYKPDIVAGRSLGTAVAIDVASKNSAPKLLLITPIDSILNIAKSRYPFLPISMLLKDKFQADIWAKNLKAKVAVVLVENENIVPKKSMDNILGVLGKRVIFKTTIKGANHIDIYSHNIADTIKNALDSLI
jgi:hypothetical protein